MQVLSMGCVAKGLSYAGIKQQLCDQGVKSHLTTSLKVVGFKSHPDPQYEPGQTKRIFS